MLNACQISKIEAKINYCFNNKILLQQAFIRKSYALSFGCADNEVLEFYGDRVLDYAVMIDMYDRFGKINYQNEFISCKSVGDLSKLDIELIRNSNLADQIKNLGLKKYLHVISKIESHYVKINADLFEAILGAVAIDSGWDNAAIMNVYRSMMISFEKAKIIEPLKDDYIGTLETLIWSHKIRKTDNIITKNERLFFCKFVIILNGKFCKIEKSGKTKNEAISSAYEVASKLIYLLIEKQLINDDTYKYADQLYLLYNYGFISEPQFHFEYYPKNSNNSHDVWRCYVSFSEDENEYMTEDMSIADAKEHACYVMLCKVLGIGFDQTEIENNQNYIASASEPVIHGQGLLKYILSMYKNVA